MGNAMGLVFLIGARKSRWGSYILKCLISRSPSTSFFPPTIPTTSQDLGIKVAVLAHDAKERLLVRMCLHIDCTKV